MYIPTYTHTHTHTHTHIPPASSSNRCSIYIQTKKNLRLLQSLTQHLNLHARGRHVRLQQVQILLRFRPRGASLVKLFYCLPKLLPAY